MSQYPHLNSTYISPRLQSALCQIGSHAITTIIAPMGYGKSTAVKWWQQHEARQIPDACILRQLVATDSKADFWDGFCRTLRRWPTLAAQLRALGYPEGPHTRFLLCELLQDALAAFDGPVYFILDDVYLLQSGDLPGVLSFLAERLPPGVHMILVSRNHIFSESARLRLGSGLLEIVADDLRLTQPELELYAACCGLPLPQTQARTLCAVSEGWIAMIYLCFRAYVQTHEWRFDTHNIYTLIEQVMFDPLGERRRRFLLYNCVTEEFTRTQAAFVWQEADADVLLHDLTHNNAFIVSGAGGVYRYHHMLRQLLRRKFELLDPAVQNRVLARVGLWFLQAKDYLPAAEFFRRAGEWPGVLRAAALDCGKSLGGEHRQMLLDWCRNCPPEILQQNPDAVCVLMRKLFSFGQIPEMLRLRGLLLEGLQNEAAYTPQQRDNYLGECDLVMSFLAYNDIGAMSALHRSASTRMTRTTRCIDLDGTWTFGSPSILMMFHRTAGGADAENAQMRECMPCYYRITDGHGSGAEYSMQAETELLRGQLTDAEISCHLAADAAASRGQYSILLTVEFVRMRMALLRADQAAAEDMLCALRRTLKQQRQFIVLRSLELCQAWLDAQSGCGDPSGRWFMTPEADASFLGPMLPMLRTVQNEVLLASGAWTKLLSRADQCAAINAQLHALLADSYLHIHLACANARLGRTEDARQELDTALSLALPDAFYLPFAEHADDLGALLPEALQSRGETAAADAVARLCAIKTTAPAPQDYGLTSRELEIARLAAARRTNTEIAQALHLSESTVKNHLKRIFDKLGLDGGARGKRVLLASLLPPKDSP